MDRLDEDAPESNDDFVTLKEWEEAKTLTNYVIDKIAEWMGYRVIKEPGGSSLYPSSQYLAGMNTGETEKRLKQQLIDEGFNVKEHPQS